MCVCVTLFVYQMKARTALQEISTIKGSVLKKLSKVVHFLLNNVFFYSQEVRKPHSALACVFLYMRNMNEYYIKVKAETLYLCFLLELHEKSISAI